MISRGTSEQQVAGSRRPKGPITSHSTANDLTTLSLHQNNQVVLEVGEDLNEMLQTLSYLDNRLLTKKCDKKAKDEEAEAHEEIVAGKRKRLSMYASEIRNLETADPYWLPHFEKERIQEYTRKRECLHCEIAKEVEFVSRLKASSREIEQQCDHLESVIADMKRELQRKQENQRVSIQSMEDSIASNYPGQKLEELMWYWGNLSKKMSRNVIQLCPLGSFLVRDSASVPGEYVLAFKMHDMVMIKVKHVEDKYGLSVGLLKFSSIPELVTYYQTHSLAEVDPSIDLTLTKPIEKYVLDDSSESSDDGDDFSDNEERDGVSPSPHNRADVSARTKSGKWNYYDPDKYIVTMSKIIDFVPSLAQHWELLGHKLDVGQTVRNLRETQLSTKSKCIQVLEEWLDKGEDNTWLKLLSSLQSLQLTKIVQHIIQERRLQLDSVYP
jgi:hypothetical protein